MAAQALSLAADQVEIRDELTRLAHEAAENAAAAPGPGLSPRLIDVLAEREATLQASVERLRSQSGLEVSHAAEWLLDNIYVAQQAWRQVREDMPAGYYRNLPKRVDGPFQGYPRVHEIIQRFLAHESGRLNLQELRRFVAAYQEITPLTMGELWAIPVMLRLALLLFVADAAERAARLTEPAASSHLPAVALTPSVPDDQLLGHCFTGLRLLDAQDWQAFFESVSLVEKALRLDPARLYTGVQALTRNRYRSMIEVLAKGSQVEEVAVAEAAVRLARAAAGDPGELGEPWDGLSLPRTAHVGYYLLDEGRLALERTLNYRPSPKQRIRRGLGAHRTALYLGAIMAVTVALVALVTAHAIARDGSFGQVMLAALLSLAPATAAAVALVDWAVTLLVRPRVLPKLDFELSPGAAEIPDSCRTLVVIPAMLTSSAEVRSLLDQLERHFLTNPGRNLYFGLLLDGADADQQLMPGDEALLAEAREGIEELNDRHAQALGGARPFCFFHRGRSLNAKEGAWIGWERKRGKLHALNLLLRGRAGDWLQTIVGPVDELLGVKYVITLDADALLGPGAAAAMIGALAHPLNRAVHDPRTGRVIKGYGLLQPRTEIRPGSANATQYTRIFSGDTGLDLYTLAVSNVYQDVFGSGIYIGKGIYDVDAFEQSLKGRVPENALLSHDLFEGIHARAALVTDVVVYEDYPSSYLANRRRQHRWTRGDWQLLPWILPGLRSRQGVHPSSGFQPIDLWKLLDNLRRSLFAPALLLLLTVAWLTRALPGPAGVWVLVALLSLAAPVLIGALTPLVRRGLAPLAASWRTLREGGMRWLLSLVFLPYEAATMVHAIGVTLGRLFVTRRHLLQWRTSAAVGGTNDTRAGTWLSMATAPGFSILMALALAWLAPERLPLAAPFLLAWLLSPEIAYRISQPVPPSSGELTAEQRVILRRLARRTWLFFEEFVGPEDHWLPPDHYQEHPRGISSPYTSPTNIGLLLLSTLAAYDLGYMGLAILVARLKAAFESMGRLERYQGHFLNWYDTHTLEPLLPRYVSTVDSGNLAAALRIMSHACLTLPRNRVLRWERWQGLADTLGLLDDELIRIEATNKATSTASLRERLLRVQTTLLSAGEDVTEWIPAIDRAGGEEWQLLQEELGGFIEANRTVLGAEAFAGLRLVLQRINSQISVLQRYLRLLVPWVISLAPERLPRLFAAGLDGEPAANLAALRAGLRYDVTLDELPAMCEQALPTIAMLKASLSGARNAGEDVAAEAEAWCDALSEALGQSAAQASTVLRDLTGLQTQCDEYFEAMDFRFLYDSFRQVFHIGYNITSDVLDNNFYDLLASEARIASLVALAKHDAPRRHWLRLSRPLTRVRGRPALLSWSATMFEYLMPTLFMRSYEGTLLHETAVAVVARQIDYARGKGVPWGISESGYYAFDAAQNYQYRAFGVPGLGFKRDLGTDLVIAPYASLLALPFRPDAVVANVAELARLGGMGPHGLYEAIDFTPARLPLGQDHVVVREYMAHHQGMILLALANALQDDRMVERFHADRRMESVSLLLQERLPVDAPVTSLDDSQPSGRRVVETQEVILPWDVPLAETPLPHVHYLSNGRYGVLVTNGGGGFSRWRELDLTRWRPDTTLDNMGPALYLQDEHQGEMWRPTFDEGALVRFHPHKVEFLRGDHQLAQTLEVSVLLDDDVEVRRLTLRNLDQVTRRITVTSYAEVVLASQQTDERHPAFNKLFIESEYLPDARALLFHRRPRSQKEPPVYLLHLLLGSDAATEPAYETDRVRFIGREGTLRWPAALSPQGAGLSGVTGSTLDPVMCLQRTVEIAPGETAELVFLTVAGDVRAKVLEVANGYRTPDLLLAALDRTAATVEQELRLLNLDTPELRRLQLILSALTYPFHGLRAAPETLVRNQKGQPGLWGYAISGDHPILLLRIEDETGLPHVLQLLQAHTYWRRRGLLIDLVIVNMRESGYNQDMRDQIHRLLIQTHSDTWLNRRGGVFLIDAGNMAGADLTLLEATARVTLEAGPLGLDGQLEVMRRESGLLPPLTPAPGVVIDETMLPPVARPGDLQFDNGWGGFSPDGREYVIYVTAGHPTPAPWINVVANEQAGFIVSESGAGYTWAGNSGENRLTPWSNDPVLDPAGEAVYLRDEETTEVWSPTPHPAGDSAPHLVRHGPGYTVFEHNSHALEQRLRMFVPPDAPLKIVQLRLRNALDRGRRITATFYAEWVLGVNRSVAAQFVVPEFDAEHQALLATSTWNSEFAGRVAFAAASRPLHGLTADRTEFLGRQGNRRAPAALRRLGLAGVVRPGPDPCVALQVHIDLPPNGEEEIYFLLGQGANRDEVLDLLRRYSNADEVAVAWDAVGQQWAGILGAVQVETPEPAVDLLLNRWLLYQSLACRVWGRSAFYQSSGAYGFRDQLQDVMAFVHTAPGIAREQIVRASRYQFEAGDVLHWWHPPAGRGVRTRISDDLLWLPFVTAHYVSATGDESVLEEQVPFLRGAPLRETEEERYGEFEVTREAYSVWEHCRRALERGTTGGAHGLPLMGGGDWNDGMNRVGVEGRGESVWLAWFLHATLTAFAGLCDRRGDRDQANRLRERAGALSEAIEASSWDGDWYLRAFYDDGSPLGSHKNRECQIDAIAQSWSVLSGAGDPERSAEAMSSVYQRLVRPEDRLILLFTPPFDETPRDPGYIKGYVPGIRENGGQYTHAAIWTAWAFAGLGDHDRAAELFRLLNPIYRAATPEDAGRYKVEPYVIAADIYGVAPHTGRGGWTWYTGSAAWLYRLGLEGILGVRREGASLVVDPHLPPEWPGYALTYRYGKSVYRIQVRRGERSLRVDGVPGNGCVPLIDDGKEHAVEVGID